MIRMASVEQAVFLIREHGAARRLPAETVPLGKAAGRVLAAPVLAAVFQPPAAVSAMDGYAVAFADMKPGARLKVVAESRAGQPFTGAIAPGEAVRIFTGAWTPAGADHILIQEDAKRDGDSVEVAADQPTPSSIRRKGLDFTAGETLVPAGHRLAPGALSLSAAGNAGAVSVRRRPRIGVLANGDELAAPGSTLAPGQIVNSIAPALLALLAGWDVEPVDLGVARDDPDDVRRLIATPCDVIVTIGGASVGDYDVVRTAFADADFAPVFEKVAVKPGKPTWFSASPGQLVLGLPGNPAAAMVTAQLFLKPLIDAMLGASSGQKTARARVSAPLPAVGGREEYLRAVLVIGETGKASVHPAEDQDSSLLSPFLTANALIRRQPGAPAAAAGDLVDIILME
jgi:molybdopterin molybdotransferase